MSFEVLCPACGAVSGPSVGVCPFCKTSLAQKKTTPEQAKKTNEAHIRDLYIKEGKLQDALSFLRALEKSSPDALDDPGICELYARAMIEAEAPTSQIRAAIQRAIIKNPDASPTLRLLDLIASAKSKLQKGSYDGEAELREVLKASPDEDLALFLLGAHRFWVEGDIRESVLLLERCLKKRGTFLRAWACLGSIYKKIGNKPLAARAFQQCLRFEDSADMKRFFEQEIRALSA